MAEAAARDYSLFGDDHIAKYEDTDGEVGYLWNGATCLVLHTKGRKTGELRKFPLIFGERGDDIILVASKGGDPANPGWYLNLLAHPEDVSVQIKADVIAGPCAHRGGRRAPGAVGPHARAVARLRRLPGQHRPRDPGRGARATLIAVGDYDALDGARLGKLFDLTSAVYATRGGAFATDPYPAFARLRESGPVHEGIVGPLVGFTGEGFFQGLPYPNRPHFSAFDWATCDAVFRDGETYVSKPPPEDTPGLTNASILYMDGMEHRRYRALVQPSFLPKRALVVDRALGRRRDRRAARPHGAQRPGRPQRGVLLRHPAAHDHGQPRRVGRRCARHPGGGHLRRPRHPGVRPHRPADRAGASCRAGRRPHQRAGRGRDHRGGRQHPPPHRRRGADLLLHPPRRRLGHHVEADGHHDARAVRPSRVAGCGPRRPHRAPAGRRGDTALDAHRPDVQSVRRARHRARRRRRSRGCGGPHVPRRRQPRPVAVGATRRVRSRTPGAAPHGLRHRCPHLPGIARRAGRDRHRRSARCSTASRTCASTPTPSRRTSRGCTSAARRRCRSGSERCALGDLDAFAFAPARPARRDCERRCERRGAGR